MPRLIVSKNVFYVDDRLPPPLTLLTAEVDLRFESLDMRLSLAMNEDLRTNTRDGGGAVRTTKLAHRNLNPPHWLPSQVSLSTSKTSRNRDLAATVATPTATNPTAVATITASTRTDPVPQAEANALDTVSGAAAPDMEPTVTGTNYGVSIANAGTALVTITRSHGQGVRPSLIPKPDGEPGRKESGGYNLQEQVGWAEDKYEELKIRVYELVDNILDKKLSITKQNVNAVAKVMDTVAAEFPQVERYVNAWPVYEMIKMRLKYTVSQKGITKKRPGRAAKSKANEASAAQAASMAQVDDDCE